MQHVSTDPIADMLTRIRNALAVNKNEVSLPYSQLKEGVAAILKDNGFITKLDVSGEGIDKMLHLQLPTGASARLTEIERLSKPGRRLYAHSAKIPVVKRGRGIVVVSTSKGLMTGEQAKAQGVGGELICKVY